MDCSMKTVLSGRRPAFVAGLTAGVAPLLLAVGAHAQTCDPSSASLEWAERVQLVQQTQRSADAVRYEARAAGLQGPVSVDVEAATLLGENAEADLMALAVWTRDFARSSVLAHQLGELRAAAVSGEAEVLRMTAAATVLGVFDQAIGLHDTVELAMAEGDYLRQVLDTTRALVDGGEAGELDLLRIEQRLRAAVRTQETNALELAAVRRTLAALAPESCAETAALAYAPMSLETASPRLAALQATLAALAAEADVQARSARPELSVGAGPRLVTDRNGAAPGFVIALSVTPRRAAERRMHEARLLADTDRVGVSARVEDHRSELALPWIELAEQLEARALVESQQGEDLARRILEAIRVGYAGGEVDLSAVLDAHDALALEARSIADVRARARRARLHALTLLVGETP